MAKKRVTVDLEDVETMFGELADELDRKGKLSAEEVAAVNPQPIAEAEANQPRTLRRRLTETFRTNPLLGWPLTIFLWLIIAVNLYLIITRIDDSVFYLPDVSSPVDLLGLLGFGLLSNLFPVLRIAAAFLLFRYRRPGIYLYAAPSLLWMGWRSLEYTDESTGPFFLREIAFLVILCILLIPKWHDFE